ncbi:MAG: PAS domain S-box protein [Burkholderiales bacterium]
MATQASDEGAATRDAALAGAIEAAVGSGIAVIDPDGRIAHVNAAFCRMVGWSETELLGRQPPFPHWPEGERARMMGVLASVLDGCFPQDGMQATFRRRSGEAFPVLLYAQPLVRDGAARGCVANVVDLSVQERRERERREGEERLRMTQEAAQVGFWEWDLATGRTYWSPQCARNFGAGPDVPRTDIEWRKRVHPDDLARVDAAWTENAHRREPIEVEHRVVADSGEIKWLLVRCEADYDAAGNAIRLRGINLDITQRKRAEERLRMYERILASMQEGVVVVGPDTLILYVNPKAEAMFGYEPGELIGKHVSVINAPGDLSPEMQAAEILGALQRDGVWQGEVCNITKQGRRFWCYGTVSRLDHPELGSVMVGVQTDISERKRIEARLAAHHVELEATVRSRTAELEAAKGAAEAANIAKSAFLANISHEIRSPLQAITGSVSLLRRSSLTAQQEVWVDWIVRAGQHLLEIINQVLELSRIEAGKLDLVEAEVDVGELVRDVVDMVAEAAEGKGLALRSEAPRLPAGLRGDPTRIRQALLNYASNAVKFTERGTVAVRCRVLADEGDGLRLRFEVEDSGIGIGAEGLSRLFAPFEQVDASSTRRHGGTGLGLAITRRLAELMGGEAGAESEPGVGSTFWFTVRLAKATPRHRRPASVAMGAAEARLRTVHRGRRILLVEDDPIVQQLDLYALNEAGLVVDLARDGREAVRMAEGADYDVIVMDVQMPNMNGLEATRRIRALARHAATPIVAKTANAFDEERRACLAAGMSDLVAKPVDTETLFSTLLRWLDTRAA